MATATPFPLFGGPLAGNLPPERAWVTNRSVAYLAEQINRFVVEFALSDSANTNAIRDFDMVRLQGFLDHVNFMLDAMNAAPALDLQKSRDVQWNIGRNFIPDDLNNELVNQLIRLFIALRLEILNAAQTATFSAGIDPADFKRFKSYTQDIQNYIENVVRKVSPQDLPASSPADPSGPPQIQIPGPGTK